MDNDSFDLIHNKLIEDSNTIKKLNSIADLNERHVIEKIVNKNLFKNILAFYLDRKYENAILLLREHPQNNYEINILSALCYYNLYNYAEALIYILIAEDQSTESDKIYRIKAIILCEKGRKENSRESILKAKEIFDNLKHDQFGWQDLYNMGIYLVA